MYPPLVSLEVTISCSIPFLLEEVELGMPNLLLFVESQILPF
jgi:hypothetical protein